MSRRIAIVSDLHANRRALDAALRAVDDAAPDDLVVLGDLLTYGLDVAAVLECVDALAAKGAAVVLGNHDQLYLDLAVGKRAYLDGVPPWIAESVERTLAALDLAAFADRYAWRTHLRLGDVLLAHANPFAYGDWTYLNDPAQLDRAHDAVAAAGARVGVFGHNHRAGAHVRGAAQPVGTGGGDARIALGAAPVLVNAGSIGQPRSREALSTFAVLDVSDDHVVVSLRPVSYDVAAHCASISAAGFTDATREKLLGFFTPARAPSTP